MALPASAAAQYDPVRYSDYNNLYNYVSDTLGPIPVDGGNVFGYRLARGYGQATTTFNSLLYPFTRTITNITNANPAVVTTSLAHNLVADEVVYLANFTQAGWNTSPLEGNYQIVDQILTPTTFTLRNVDTRLTNGYVAWGTGQTGQVTQPIISANQFNNLKTDVNKIVKHTTGVNATVAQLPVVTRGTAINHSVYLPYYNTVDSVYNSNLKLGESIEYLSPTRPSRTASWNSSITTEFTVVWPTEYDFVQYFNTGGLLKFNILVTSITDPPRTAKNQSYADLATNNFPVFYGAYNKATMGYTDTTKWTSAGAYSASLAGYNEIYKVSPSGTYALNYYRIQHRLINARTLSFIVSAVDDVANAFAQDVTADFEFNLSLIYTTGSVTLNINPLTQIAINYNQTWNGS